MKTRRSLAKPTSINELNVDLFQPEEVDRFADPKEARKKAMDYLARREYGQTELINKLCNAGFHSDVSASEVERLTEDNLQSDQRFAESFVQSRINQGKGPVRIRLDLSQRGVADSEVEYAIEASAANWYELARDVRQRKFGVDQPFDFQGKAKQMRFLQYRGFEQDHIQAAFRSE